MPHNEPLRTDDPAFIDAELWKRPDIARALSTCDFSTLLEAVRSARGWSQAELAHTVGYSQSWVSRVVNARQSLTLDQVAELCNRLGIPSQLLGFAQRPRKATPALRSTEQSPQPRPLRPVATNPGETNPENSGTAQRLRSITGGQRRLEGTLPARDLARSIVAHLDMSDRILSRAHQAGVSNVPEIAAAASEAAGLAAWLHMDMGDAGSARGYYRVAIRRARQSRHGLLTAYMLGSLAAFETEEDEPDVGLSLTESAGRFLGPQAHPTAAAWLSGIRALAHTGRGDTTSARAELASAERNIEHTANTDPPWPWVFPFDGGKLARYRALAAARSGCPTEALSSFVEAFHHTVPPPKQRAVLLVDWAQAHSDSGGADTAFQLALEALTLGAMYRSDRVVSRVRRFRRFHRGPQPPQARDLDARLAELAATGSGPVLQREAQ